MSMNFWKRGRELKMKINEKVILPEITLCFKEQYPNAREIYRWYLYLIRLRDDLGKKNEAIKFLERTELRGEGLK